MDWKKEAEGELRLYDARRRSISNLQEKLRELEIRSRSLRSAAADGTPVKGGGSGREDACLDNIVERTLTEEKLELARLQVSRMERALGALTEQERKVLERLYIYPGKGNMARLCEELGVEKNTAYYHRDKALHKFTVAMYGSDSR